MQNFLVLFLGQGEDTHHIQWLEVRVVFNEIWYSMRYSKNIFLEKYLPFTEMQNTFWNICLIRLISQI